MAISGLRASLDGTAGTQNVDDHGVGSFSLEIPSITLASDATNGSLLGGFPDEQSSREQRNRLRPHDATAEHRLRLAERDERLVLSERNERYHHKLKSQSPPPQANRGQCNHLAAEPFGFCHIVTLSHGARLPPRTRRERRPLKPRRIAESPTIFDFIALREIDSCAIVFSFVRTPCAPCQTPGAEVEETKRDLDLLGWIWTCLIRFGLAGKTLNLAATKRLPHGFSRGWSGRQRAANVSCKSGQAFEKAQIGKG